MAIDGWAGVAWGAGTISVLTVVVAACSSSTSSPRPGPTCGAGTVLVEEKNECEAIDGRFDAAPPADSGVSVIDTGADAGCKIVKLYVDKDGDGYGVGVTNVDATQGCEGLAGYAPKNGDCADADDRAHPGQADFFTTTIKGVLSPGFSPWDFNCDGDETRRYPDPQACSTTLHPPGWHAPIGVAIPSCGQTGLLHTSMCEGVPTVQACH